MSRIDVVTLFPEMVTSMAGFGVTGRAVKDGLLGLKCWNPRDFTHDRHRTVDDRPYGGGPGMVMMVQPLRDAIRAAKSDCDAAGTKSSRVVYLSPQGRRMVQADVRRWADENTRLILVAGRYEGIDERLIETEIDEELSVGDYVLSGGELAALIVIDALARLIPGALGHDQSAELDSFSDGLLECGHYTRPEVIDGMRVPEVLLSGDHARIERWRLKQALGRTWRKRPDLLEGMALDAEREALLAEYIDELKGPEQG